MPSTGDSGCNDSSGYISFATPGSYDNQVTVTGQDPEGTGVSDESTDGTNPDPNGDGNPNEGGVSSLLLEAQALPIPVLGEIGIGLLAILILLAAVLTIKVRRG